MAGCCLNCCVINSAIGFVLFMLLALLVGTQINFLNFKIESKSASVISCLITGFIYLALFIVGMIYIRRQSQAQPTTEFRRGRDAREGGVELGQYAAIAQAD